MSWFNATHLSSFAKQAFTTAQKSIDRVLDIKEEDQWGDTVMPSYDVPGTGSSASGGWGTTQWASPPEESISSGSTEAITTPVTRTVVDESEHFFSVFLSSTDLQSVKNTPVVSIPPTKAPRPKEENKEISDTSNSRQTDLVETTGKLEIKAQTDPRPENIELTKSDLDVATDGQETLKECKGECVNEEKISDNSIKIEFSEVKLNQSVSPTSTSTKATAGNGQSVGSPPDSPAKPHTESSKDLILDSKDAKSEDRQSHTPSPPVSTFSSGTSTTSDIEVLDHDSVISESSASSRQESNESKASLHLMQTSFQLLSASACSDFQRLDDYQKLTESSGSSDAFERIDSFSMQTLDSRSSKSEELNDTVKDRSLEENEMEESCRSATPVNCEEPEELIESDQASSVFCTVTDEPEQTSVHPTSKEGQANPVYHNMQKVIDDLTIRLEKRETQILAVSKDKARLEEEYDNLKDEMINLKEECCSVQSLKEEFTQRIADAEKKAQLACKERDALKKEVKTLKEELSTRLNSNETAEIIKEKDEQIKGLLEEGEKLSKQQLHNSNSIKKLRVKDKENESLLSKQSKKIKELEEELKHLQQVLDGKEEVERQHRESIKKLNSVVERQENELSRHQTDLEEFQETNRSLQAALDNSYKELAELHRANATKDSKAQEAALSREIQAKEQLSVALEKAREESRMQQEALAMQVGDLRLALQRAEQQQGRKEDYLREEISELQQRLQGAESRNQELSQSVTSATRPLLRQIENLQATLGAQTTSWEKLEKNISDRLADAQAQLAAAVEKERAAIEELLTIKSQMATIESQNSLIRQEKSLLQVQLESEKSKRERLEDESSREHEELENVKADYTRLLEESKKQKMLLTSQLEMEKLKVEQEKKKYFLSQEALKEKERKAFVHPALEATTLATPTLSRSSSISGVDMASLHSSFLAQDDALDHSFGPMTTTASGSNLYDAVRMGAGSSVIENLQSQLKLREGEIMQLQFEISNLEKTRTVMAEELVKLTNQNDELEDQVKEIPRLRVQLRDLDQRYNTILQMYGEKAEEAEELRLDLEDVKSVYKIQIDELLKTKK
ncbi:TMF1 factor, partial [Polyodon spathula]|nr:TMF1 factor [Polyodon spathula]